MRAGEGRANCICAGSHARSPVRFCSQNFLRLDETGFQRDAIARDGMFHRAKRGHLFRYKTEKLARPRLRPIRIAGLLTRSAWMCHLVQEFPRRSFVTGRAAAGTADGPISDIWEFPQMRVHIPAGRWRTSKRRFLNHKGSEACCGGGFAFAEIRQFLDAVLAQRNAERFYRTNVDESLSEANCLGQEQALCKDEHNNILQISVARKWKYDKRYL